jgi:hypothetical protein
MFNFQCCTLKEPSSKQGGKQTVFIFEFTVPPYYIAFTTLWVSITN